MVSKIILASVLLASVMLSAHATNPIRGMFAKGARKLMSAPGTIDANYGGSTNDVLWTSQTVIDENGVKRTITPLAKSGRKLQQPAGTIDINYGWSTNDLLYTWQYKLDRTGSTQQTVTPMAKSGRKLQTVTPMAKSGRKLQQPAGTIDINYGWSTNDLLYTWQYKLDRTGSTEVLLFLKAHQLLSENNHQCILALQPNGSPVLYTPSSADGSAAAMPALVLERVQQLLIETPSAGQLHQQQQQQQEVALAAGLSRALCYANRLLPRYGANGRHKAKPRVLSLLAGSDTPLQYIPVMNCIFAAQHAGVALDACILGPADSAFMQQAAHITGGVYLRPHQPAALLQYLLGVFSADTATRASLSLGTGSGTQAVDYRASCFCHKNVIDTGYICSVCLSIFCKANMKLSQCPTCGSQFKQAAAAAAAAAGGAGRGRGASGAAAAAAAAAGRDGGRGTLGKQ
ncbi:transcription factor Tfb4-domain-containing protein [Scenedesmus sp. NREL 46B-D3]|nr:transcription factor Tfb4-domain-containing protein [Scenedesmus sp. NREL 46B-D3]